MTISERIFELLAEREMSQKEFSQRTGIAQSSISDWKRKKTNPVSEKILIICSVLGVTPYELLAGTDGEGNRSNPSEVIVIEKASELGQFVCDFLAMDRGTQGRLLGYMAALREMKEEKEAALRGN
ncbi:MAG: helix-turn-helix domain-containing protein [Eubacteriales bacterium]|nr:helix-turn-helix domain-containing protein [Lachnospiraceae bacterium]MDO4416922.1 helix-turn-helix domain-containing protein [Eubacteriales bacterium]